ncbi:MAG: RNA polymerase recycling motor HelD, partial [Bacillota bacterium]|nr:RNA polymerase recycling motor HelD [Bacillota bacterium]
MPALNHPDYQSEMQKLNYILQYLKEYNLQILRQKGNIDKEVEYGIRHYNSDNAEQFNDLIINSKIKENLSQKLKAVGSGLSKPYFARVDFKESGAPWLERLYIGKMSLLRAEDQEMLITDWRAPIASLYYEGRLGKANYDCPDGSICGDIFLKRQYVIDSADLKEIYDIDITTNDDFLQASLNSSKDKRLKDIVSTIQAEQNKVIRADMWKPLIVQGAAGGGKTTIALHRIAYLLYNHEDSLKPNNFMIIAPNRFFLSYISEVLPDLGVENVLQVTFEDLAQSIIGTKFKLRPSQEKLSYFIEGPGNDSPTDKKKLQDISRFKSSMDFMRIIKRYVEDIERNLIPRDDFKIDSFCLLPYEEIQRLFLIEYSYLPLMKRINELKKNLVNTLKLRKEPIMDEIELKYERLINEVRSRMKDCPERRQKIIALADKRDSLLEKIRKESKIIIKEFMNSIKFLTPYEYYHGLICSMDTFHRCCSDIIDEKGAEAARFHTENILREGTLEIEDLAPMMHIKYFIFGLDEKFTARHILIDEAQDFSLFQLYILKRIIRSGSFTILGDLCQGIHSYRGIQSWQEVQSTIFPEESPSFMTLEQSYRTTVEIMEAANAVIKSLDGLDVPLAKPVIRHGDQVKITGKRNLKEVAEAVKSDLWNIKEEGFKSAAVICKTLKECLDLKAELARLKVKCDLITGSEKDYPGGVVLIPSYLVKGLEFDAVIIANAGSEV